MPLLMGKYGSPTLLECLAKTPPPIAPASCSSAAGPFHIHGNGTTSRSGSPRCMCVLTEGREGGPLSIGRRLPQTFDIAVQYMAASLSQSARLAARPFTKCPVARRANRAIFGPESVRNVVKYPRRIKIFQLRTARSVYTHASKTAAAESVYSKGFLSA